MRIKYLTTSDLARAVGVHPNTVRRYEEWNLIPPVERSPAGYRRFTQRHLDCLRMARMVYSGLYPGPAIRRSGVGVVQCAVNGDLGGSLELAYRHLALVLSERAQADTAAQLLERWARGAGIDPASRPAQIGQVSQLMGVSIDILRNWERNGLISVPRDPANGYRRYGAGEISRLRVIRMLAQAGYSLMAIRRMLVQLDQGQTVDVREALDTPAPDEDIFTAFDRWISALDDQEQRARDMIALIEDMVNRGAR